MQRAVTTLNAAIIVSGAREAFPWAKRPSVQRKELAIKICALIKGHFPDRTQSDSFLILRIFNRLANGTETPEGIGFEWKGGEYRLSNPEAIHAL